MISGKQVSKLSISRKKAVFSKPKEMAETEPVTQLSIFDGGDVVMGLLYSMNAASDVDYSSIELFILAGGTDERSEA